MKTTGLSLVEAHNSGRKYRKPGATPGYYWRYDSLDEVTVQDAISPYWSLEPQAKLLTREEVFEAATGFLVSAHAVLLCNSLFGPEGE